MYSLSGSRQTPLLLRSGPYPQGAAISALVSGGSGNYDVQTRSDQDLTATTVRVSWGPEWVSLTSSTITFSGLASYACAYEPPPEILPLALRPGSLPHQTWEGGGCSGSFDLTVSGPEAVQAAGRTWQAWRLSARTALKIQSSLDSVIQMTSWLAPDLGLSVKDDILNTGTLTGQPYQIEQHTLLQSHP